MVVTRGPRSPARGEHGQPQHLLGVLLLHVLVASMLMLQCRKPCDCTRIPACLQQPAAPGRLRRALLTSLPTTMPRAAINLTKRYKNLVRTLAMQAS